MAARRAVPVRRRRSLTGIDSRDAAGGERGEPLYTPYDPRTPPCLVWRRASLSHVVYHGRRSPQGASRRASSRFAGDMRACCGAPAARGSPPRPGSLGRRELFQLSHCAAGSGFPFYYTAKRWGTGSFLPLASERRKQFLSAVEKRTSVIKGNDLSPVVNDSPAQCAELIGGKLFFLPCIKGGLSLVGRNEETALPA